jgi:hypothetical protein
MSCDTDISSLEDQELKSGGDSKYRIGINMRGLCMRNGGMGGARESCVAFSAV